MDPLILSVIAIFLGVLMRTGIIYLKKRREAAQSDPPADIPFDMDYAYTATLALVISFAETMLLLPAFTVPDVPTLLVFSNGFGFGFTSNSILNEIIS